MPTKKKSKKGERMLIDIPKAVQKNLSAIAKNKGMNGKKIYIEWLAKNASDAFEKKQIELFNQKKIK